MTETAPRRLELEDADVVMFEHFFDGPEADRLFMRLRDDTAWEQRTLSVRGRDIRLPRLTAWHGDDAHRFAASDITMTPATWTPELLYIKKRIEAVSDVTFNGVLLTLYRDRDDGVAWHTDDEAELGPAPTIGSVSFGAARRFELRHKTRPGLEAAVMLSHGSYLMMAGRTQECWEHRIPRAADDVGVRINLTFRRVQAAPPEPDADV